MNRLSNVVANAGLTSVVFFLLLFACSYSSASDDFTKRLNNFGLTNEDLYVYRIQPDESSQTLQQQLVISNNLYAHYFSEYERYEQAKEVYLKLLSNDLSQLSKANVLRSLAMLEAEANNIKPALKYVTDALSSSDKDIESLVLKSKLLIAQSEAEKDKNVVDALLNEALQALNTAKELQTSNTLIYESLGKVYLEKQDITKLLDCYRSIAKIMPRDLNYRMVLANLLLRTNNPKEAITHLEDVVSQRRSFIQGYIMLAEANIQLYQPRAALKWVKNALLIEPNNSTLQKLFDTCSTLISKSGKQSAIQQYKKFADDYPHAVSIQKLYAMKLEDTKQPFEKIIAQWENVLSADPYNTENLNHIASLYTDQKQYKKALDYVRKSLDLDAANYQSLVLAVIILKQLNMADEANKIVEKAIRLNPGDGATYYLLAKLQESEGRTSESRSTIISGANAANPSADLLAAYGEILSKDGDTSKALTAFEGALQKDRKSISVILRYHEFMLRNNELAKAQEFVDEAAKRITKSKDEFWNIMTDSAIECYSFENACQYAQNSLAITPNQPMLIVKLISMWNMMSEYEKSIEFLSSSKGQDYLSDLSGALLLASSYWYGGKHQEAQQLLEEYKAKHTDNLVPVWQLQLDFALDNNNKQEAMHVINEVEQKLGIGSSDVAIMKSYYYMKQKNYKQAIAALKKGIEDSSSSEKQQSMINYLLGCVYSDTDMLTEATSHFKKAIELSPENDSALNGLGYLWAEHDMNLDEAEILINKALQYSPLSPHILDSKGWVLYKKNQCKEAMIWLKLAQKYSLKDDEELSSHIKAVSDCLSKQAN